MFKIDKEYIKQNCTGFSFDRGLEYHFGNRVRAIQYNPNKRVFTAVVHDLKERNVSVSFDASGGLVNAQCNCRALGKTPDTFCEHIVAVLLLIERRDGEGFFNQMKDREKARRIFELFSFPQNENQSKTGVYISQVGLDAILLFPSAPRAGSGDRRAPEGAGFKIDDDYKPRPDLNAFRKGVSLYDSFYRDEPERASRVYFRLRSGASAYIIKNIGKFVKALSNKRPVDFSKKFTFDPSAQTLEGFDAEIGDFLLEIYEATAVTSKTGLYADSYNTEVFADKCLCLTDRQLRRFVGLYAKNGKPLLAGDGVNTAEVCVREEGIPVSFKLERDGGDFLLHIEAMDDLWPLTAGCDIVFQKNTIYILPKSQADIMRQFLSLLVNYGDRDFRFVSEDRGRFVSEVLPAIDRIGSLVIDEDVSTLIERRPISADICLDREDGAVSADVRFRYGETEINPFAATVKAKAAGPGERIIVRDVARENIILDILAEADFKVKNGKINLYDDDSIFNFITNILPKLQNYADVYYSQEFRRMTIRRDIGFRANLAMKDGPGGGLSDLLEFSFDTELIDRAELIEIMRGIREKKKYYKLKDGALLNLGEREANDVMRLFDAIGARDEDILNGSVTLPRYRALYLDYMLRSSEIHNIGRDRILREFIRALSEPAETEYEPPGAVASVLRDYQRTGFKWLKSLSEYSLGGILADDMGLGKTLQALALLLSAKAERVPPSLIVAPTSLIYNWCAEINKFTPGLSYIAVSGSKSERSRLIAAIPGHDVVITSYPLIRRDYEDYKKIAFNYCILDEAQYIKNPQSQNAFSVKCLNARSRFALTGTPIENRLMDLWSIFDFVLPGYLYTAKSFYEKYAAANSGDDASRASEGAPGGGGDGAPGSGRESSTGSGGDGAPGGGGDGAAAGVSSENPSGTDEEQSDPEKNSQSFDDNAQSPEEDSDEVFHMRDATEGLFGKNRRGGAFDELSGQIKPFIMRRLKADVLRELPDKIDTRMYAQMTPGQKTMYLVYLEKVREQLASEIASNGFNKSQIVILAALTRLRQICCHPSLFIENYDDDSGKFLLMQEVAREALGGGHRILLFSQFTEMLAIIKKWADKEGVPYFYIDGQVKAFDRHRMINDFNNGVRDMFLLSLKAGGAGINLTGADTVIHYDPWWNPAVEDQATDRAYRIGQHKTVQVIKLVTAGSIEEKINAIQERKKMLIDAVIRPGETFLTKMSKADLDELLAVE